MTSRDFTAEFVEGGSDSTGSSLPFCDPDTHRDGKHSMLCFAAALGYQRVEGGWKRKPTNPLTIPGARWSYEGRVYVRPVDRGISLEDESDLNYIEELPSGDYMARVEFVRLDTSVGEESA